MFSLIAVEQGAKVAVFDIDGELVSRFIIQIQGRSQNAEKITHIKGRLLERALILIHCVPCQNMNFS